MSDQIEEVISAATALRQDAGPEPGGRWWLAVALIHPDPDQPRGGMDTQDELQELASSLRGANNAGGKYAHGQLQPVVVRPDPQHTGDGVRAPEWILVAGERRWRAARKGGLQHIWAARTPESLSADDIALLKAQITENELRADLSDIDIALAAERLQEAGCSVGEINALLRYGTRRTLEQKRKVARELHPEARQMIRQGALPGTHGRVLIRVPKADQPAYCRFAVAHKLGTRDLDALVRAMRDEPVSVGALEAAHSALIDERRQLREVRAAGAPVLIRSNGEATIARIVPPALQSVQALKNGELTPDELYRALLADLEQLRPFCTRPIRGATDATVSEKSEGEGR